MPIMPALNNAVNATDSLKSWWSVAAIAAADSMMRPGASTKKMKKEIAEVIAHLHHIRAILK